MGKTGYFNFKEVTSSINGVLCEGFAEGDDVIDVTPNSELSALTVGADGEAAVSALNDESAEIKMKFLQTSKMNDVLSALAASRARFPFVLKDNNGTSIAVAETCWVKKKPNLTMGSKQNSREWLLETGSMNTFVGGNNAA